MGPLCPPSPGAVVATLKSPRNTGLLDPGRRHDVRWCFEYLVLAPIPSLIRAPEVAFTLTRKRLSFPRLISVLGHHQARRRKVQPWQTKNGAHWPR